MEPEQTPQEPRPGDRPALRLRKQLIIERSIGIPLLLLLIAWIFMLKTGQARVCFIRVPGADTEIAVSDEASGTEALERLVRDNAGTVPVDAIRLRPRPILALGAPDGAEVRSVDQAVAELQALSSQGILEILADAVVMYVDGVPAVAVRTEEDVDIVLAGLKQHFAEAIPKEKLIGAACILEEVEPKAETRHPNAIVTSRDQAQRRLLESADEGLRVWVGPDDTLQGYISQHGVSKARIAELNPDVDLERLSVGQSLLLVRPQSVVTVEVKFEETVTEEQPFETVEVATPDLEPGKRDVRVKGRPGEASVTYLVTRHNDVDVERKELHRTEIRPPTDEKVLVGPSSDADATTE